jgi:hypothetical protein
VALRGGALILSCFDRRDMDCSPNICAHILSGWSTALDVMKNSRREMLVHSLLDDAAAEVPLSPAVRDAVGAWTYAELTAYSHAVEVELDRRGVGRGDRVVTQLPTTRSSSRCSSACPGAARCSCRSTPA